MNLMKIKKWLVEWAELLFIAGPLGTIVFLLGLFIRFIVWALAPGFGRFWSWKEEEEEEEVVQDGDL